MLLVTLPKRSCRLFHSPTLLQACKARLPVFGLLQLVASPGAGLAILTRSANSLANGQQPLIILDGVFLVNTTLADINSEDIVKIEVL